MSNSSRKRPLKRSQTPFCISFPAMKCLETRFSCAQACMRSNRIRRGHQTRSYPAYIATPAIRTALAHSPKRPSQLFYFQPWQLRCTHKLRFQRTHF